MVADVMCFAIVLVAKRKKEEERGSARNIAVEYIIGNEREETGVATAVSRSSFASYWLAARKEGPLSCRCWSTTQEARSRLHPW